MCFKLARMKNRGWIVFLLSALIYGANFWGTSIYILDEAKNAGCAMEMKQRGDWIVPTFNGELRTDKPPLHYFFMAATYSIFGVNPFSARLFSVVAGVLLVLLVYCFVRRNFNESTAFTTSLMLLSSLQLAIQFHLAVPDPYLILFITTSILFFYEGLIMESRSKMLLFYVAVSLGFITKGLVAIVFPGIIILLFLILRKEFSWAVFKKLNLPLGILIFCLIGLPWYIAVGYQTNGVWLEGFFFKHNVARFTSTMEGHKGFFLSPFLILIVGLLPFSFVTFQAIRFNWRLRLEKPFIQLCLITLLVIPGFFAFSKTLLPSYPAPALPFFAIILGIYWTERFIKISKTRWFELLGILLYILISIAIPIGVYIAMGTEFEKFHFEYLSIYFILLPVGALIATVLLIKNRRKSILSVLSSSWLLTSLLFFYVCFPVIDKINPVTQSLTLLSDFNVAYYGDLNPAYVLALKKPMQKLSSQKEVSEFLDKNGRVITAKKYLDELSSLSGLKILFIQKDLFENPTTVILGK
jgi:4-amino-4-deoxy-L-arabinose transferase-like glycosyltransferase